MSLVGKKNAYYCDRCARYTITVDVDEGVTPFMLRCRAGDECDGMAQSMMYPPEPWPEGVPTEPTFEWFRPAADELAALSPAMRDHVDRGGLDIRPVS